MRLAILALALAVPSMAFAQGEEGGGEEPTASEEKTPEGETQPAEASKPEAAVTDQAPAQADPFQIRRGFFAEAGLGVYFTFGGRNTNDTNPDNPYPKKGISNVQPYLALTFGYDLVHSDSFALNAGLRLSAGYSGGAGRVTDEEIANNFDEVSTKPSDFAVLETGVAVGAAFFVSERVALTVKVDGGLAAVDPNPTRFASEEGASSAAFAPIVGGGLGVEYFTLLNDFSVGTDLRFAMVLLSGSAIPSASVSIPVKYTF